MSVLVAGLGEVGAPLLSILSSSYDAVGKDVDPLILTAPVDVMHVCYPYTDARFMETTLQYIAQYQPHLTVVHSTVVPGVTRRLHEETGRHVAYSPVRGKHSRMREDLLSYAKYIASPDEEGLRQTAAHLQKVGMRVEVFSSPEALELTKLLETTYFGLLVAWAQEMERYSRTCGVDYDEVTQFFAEVGYLPPVAFQPGYIGGHCVIPNTYLLEVVRPSAFIEVIRSSNEGKRQEWVRQGRSADQRLTPRGLR